ncbi:DUF2958 domain-containing protein [Streptomyces sp. 891-h]|uniref:DUF2958 domain-containing protein n=1 Tax=Streptomyces sp. 891-h TaxID=2720714 RepID=UPI001FA9B33B|nr:DUF2958 domain-containing protein [Streptomyces sp. 891-h]
MDFPSESLRIERGHDFYPRKRDVKEIPGIRETQAIPFKEKTVYLHYFVGGCDWYVAEFDRNSHEAFGFACVHVGEWGYFGLPELEKVKVRGLFPVERDLSFRPMRAGDIHKIAAHLPRQRQ